jgi:hypothetical protein
MLKMSLIIAPMQDFSDDDNDDDADIFEEEIVDNIGDKDASAPNPYDF